ncbi:MAG: A24 family peptidase [Firmicutes bacterium]|nr:A24 family peptidase [Bacillota bacterium]
MTGREPLALVLAAAFGLVVGSFLNVCIWRLPRRQSVVVPGSYCPACERPLLWWELIPLLSYVFLGGKCRTCGARISPVYPLVEAGNALVYVMSLLVWGWTVRAAAAALLGSLLIVVSVVDGRHRLIPDRVTIPGMVCGLVLSALDPTVGWWRAAAGLLLGGGLLLGIAVATDGGMGGGDVKLAAMMGAFLGWSSLLAALLVGFVFGALWGGALVLAGRKGRRDQMAFGPFLATGGLVAAFWGPALVGWYTGLL